jgi:hypothetical protein
MRREYRQVSRSSIAVHRCSQIDAVDQLAEQADPTARAGAVGAGGWVELWSSTAQARR